MTSLRRPRRVFSRFRPGGPRPWTTRLAVVLLSSAMVAVGIILVLRPFAMARDAGVAVKQQLTANAKGHIAALYAHFSAKLAPPMDPATAPPEVLAQWLVQEPHVSAVLQRPQGRLWMRKTSGLVPSAPEAAYLDLARIAERSVRETEIGAWDATGGVGCSVSPGWITFWEWRAGSPALEALLRGAGLGPDSDFIPAFQTGAEGALPIPLVGNAATTALQQAKLRVTYGASFFPETWTFWVAAKEATDRRPHKAYTQALLWGWAHSLAIAGAVALGFAFLRRHKRREALDADRLANITHSLKTPLAVLKLRCDTLRLGRASETEARHELSQMGVEVDRLATIIDQALRRFRGQETESVCEAVSPDWFRRFTDELEPAFQAEGRSLDVELAAGAPWASLPSLRSALLTLLENALNHGAGKVRLETKVVGHQFTVRISDEGPGLPPAFLRRLGRPFQRIRKPGQEGFERAGIGLGLHLLIQSAHQEGWGLEMLSGPGMVVTLRMDAAENP